MRMYVIIGIVVVVDLFLLWLGLGADIRWRIGTRKLRDRRARVYSIKELRR